MESIVFIDKNEAMTDSVTVAKAFGKRHDHVIRDIEKLIKGLPKNGDTPTLFIKAKYVHPQNGEQYPLYKMNRDGFSLLVMGFTGKKALEWKLKYIEAFNRMEAFIRSKEYEIRTRRDMTDAIRDTGMNDAMHGYAYSTLTDLSYRTAVGKNARQLRAELNLGKKQSPKEFMSTDEVKDVERAEAVITAMLYAGAKYDAIKATLNGIASNRALAKKEEAIA